MRVLFLTLYPETAASPRYRVAQYLPYLRAHGVDFTVASAVSQEVYAKFTGPGRTARPFWYHAFETPRRLAQILGGRRYDIVFVQKALMSAYLKGVLGLLRRCAKRIVVDVDDAVHEQPPHPLGSRWRWLEDREQVNRLFSVSDLVLAGNDWLADEARKTGCRVETLPTVVDTERFAPSGDGTTPFRIGWIGGSSTTRSLEVVLPVLNDLEDMETDLVGADRAQLSMNGLSVRDWTFDTEVKDIQGFSVGIMPVPKTEWSKGKCALKAIQYMACGVACVATPFGAVQDLIRDGENGLFADTQEEWRDAFERLRDPALRKKLGEAGRATVQERYSLDATAPRFVTLLESVL